MKFVVFREGRYNSVQNRPPCDGLQWEMLPGQRSDLPLVGGWTVEIETLEELLVFNERVGVPLQIYYETWLHVGYPYIEILLD